MTPLTLPGDRWLVVVLIAAPNMWNNVKTRLVVQKTLHGVCNSCIQRCVSVGLWGRRSHSLHRHCRPVSDRTCLLSRRPYSTAGPPWRVLFFGTDDFAVESLKLLASSRESSERVVGSLEVVTLSNDVPVKRFADQNQLLVHSWPPADLTGRFDVGVVVSFGCLLREELISQFPNGILNIHPSLLPRWRGPAPVFHTILHGDTVTGVSVIQIRPRRFDVGPILHQETYQVPPHCTADQLGATLATKGAYLLIDTLKTLSERIANKREQSLTGATLAVKSTFFIRSTTGVIVMCAVSLVIWMLTCHFLKDKHDQADNNTSGASDEGGRCHRRNVKIPLRTIWMGKTIKLLDFAGRCYISLSGRGRIPVPGTISFLKESNTLAVCCKDGWVGFKAVILKRRMSAADFYNGYLHRSVLGRSPQQAQEGLFLSPKDRSEPGEDSLTPHHHVLPHTAS